MSKTLLAGLAAVAMTAVLPSISSATPVNPAAYGYVSIHGGNGPAAPASTVVASHKTSTSVFFDTNSALLTTQGKEAVRAMAAVNTVYGGIAIDVVGHADRVGSAGYNLDMAAARALVVKAELVKAGVPPAAITAITAGEQSNLTPTTDGKARAANRRVEIIVHSAPMALGEAAKYGVPVGVTPTLDLLPPIAASADAILPMGDGGLAGRYYRIVK